MSVFRVGFLCRSESFRFPGCDVTVVPDFAERAKATSQRSLNRGSLAQGFVYPERGEHLFRLPASHAITVDDAIWPAGTKRDLAAFLMHLLGLLHGAWLQFEDWWLDRRVHSDPHEAFHLTGDEVARVLELALSTWRDWKPEDRVRMTNAMFMHCRSRSYEWEWERFGLDYWVMDALWKTAKQVGRIQRRQMETHAERMNYLCDDVGLHRDTQRVSQIVALRNELMHEALWDGCQPGSAESAVTLEAPANLRRFNTRLFLALLKVPAGFVCTPWCYMGTFGFGLPR